MKPRETDLDRWHRIEELYHAAAARPPEERDAFLDQASRGDAALRAEVESLLAHAAAGTGLLDREAFHIEPALPNVSATTLATSGAAALMHGRIGPYTITARLGAGGMGEVYRARDARLDRDVAIKFLPRTFTTDGDRLARFEREARVLAALNHPNIGAIYGLEQTPQEAGPVRALVLELVEGDTLAEMIERGPMPLPDALNMARQIVDALEAAHEKGIVHRDLKPANIKRAPDGTVKVLDFGLATTTSGSHDTLTGSPNATPARTGAGVILGTAPYMSPEQARGQPVDKRTDIWAFGCVLFEMLTGARAFSGGTTSDTLAAILEREVDFNKLPAGTPLRVRRLLARALVKDPKRRLRDIGDARLELADASDAEGVAAPARRALRSGVVLTWATVIAIGLATLGFAIRGYFVTPEAPPQQPMSLFTLPLGPGESLARGVDVSPDGRFIAFHAGPDGDHKTYIRALSEGQSRVVAELPTGSNPFFSPDSQWLAFFDDGKLKKISVKGGSPITLANAPAARGGAWAADGTIVFSPAARTGLLLLSPTGGAPRELTTPDAVRGETSHRSPVFLPDSKTVLFVAEGETYARRALVAVSVETKRTRVLLQAGGTRLHLVSGGHLVYLEDGNIVAAPFDVNRVDVTGPSVTLLRGVGSFGVSSSGLLVYADAETAAARISSVTWVNRDGVAQPLPLEAKVYQYPRISPDGRRIAFHALSGTDRSLWVYDVARGAPARLTFDASNNFPVWHPDGKRVIYASNRAGTQWDIFAKPADGDGPEQELLRRPLTQLPRAVSPDGHRLVYTETDPAYGDSLWVIPLAGRAEPRPLFEKAPGEKMPSFSPDGRWIAYVSPETGRREVYVRPSGGTDGKWQVSAGGGVEPVWSPTGRELFYRAGDKMLAVPTGLSPAFSFGKPRGLFEGSYVFCNTEGQNYDVTPDGSRFLMLKPQRDNRAVEPLHIVVNWFEDLKRRVGAGQ